MTILNSLTFMLSHQVDVLMQNLYSIQTFGKLVIIFQYGSCCSILVYDGPLFYLFLLFLLCQMHCICMFDIRLLINPGISWSFSWIQEEFEDTKGAIRIRISKKNRQHNGQKKKFKRTNNDLQNIHIKLKIE